jgi:Flp pilus assembly protein TadG
LSFRLASDTRGLAAIEFALIGSFLIYGLFNSIDLGRYLYAKMEVQNAAQMGAQAVWKACVAPNLPATTICSGEDAALTAGVQSTSLGSSVTVVNGYPTESWDCVNASGALVNVAAIASKPSDCSSVGESTYLPGDYYVVETTYTYAPLFPTLSVVGTLPTPITAINYMRLQ